MKKNLPVYLALLCSLAPWAPAHTSALAHAPDVLFYSASTDGELLGDGATRVGADEVAILDRTRHAYTTFHDEGFTPCGTDTVARFGGADFLRTVLGLEGEEIDIDALHVYPWGHVAFSLARDTATSSRLGTIRHSSVVVYNPFVPPTDAAALRYLLRDDDLFAPAPLMSEQDAIFFSVTSTSGVVLGDEETTLTKSDVAVAYATDVPYLGGVTYIKAPDTIEPLYPNGYPICGDQVVVRFGGVEFFRAMGQAKIVAIDAFHVFPNGHIAFSATTDIRTRSIGRVKDGSVVVFNPYVPFTDPRSLRYLIDENELFLPLPDGAANNQDIDAFTVHDGKYYFSTTTAATLNGIAGEPLSVTDTDVIELDPETRQASIFVRGDELFPPGPAQPEEINISALSFNRHGELVFSVREAATLANGFLLTDGALGAFDPGTRTVRVYALQSALFAQGQGAAGDISALHIDIGRDHIDCAPRTVAKDPVPNDQGLNAFAVAPDGTIYFSISRPAAELNAHSGPPLQVRNGDIIAYDMGTHVARIAYSEEELFADDGGFMRTDIDALSFDARGNLVFSVQGGARVRGLDETLEVDGSTLVVIDAVTGARSILATGAGELYAAGSTADLGALHVAAALDESCEPLPGASH